MTEPASDFGGAPDGLQRLWTPHRMVYIEGDERPSDGASEHCPFCSIPQGADDDGLIVARGTWCFVVMNLFPYNSGHVLVCPYRHVPEYTDITDAEREELGAMTQLAMRVIRAEMGPAGFNLGMNQGPVAGAGIAAHLHQHVVPRWVGDANFFPIIAQTKAMPQLLADTRERLARRWIAVTTEGEQQ